MTIKRIEFIGFRVAGPRGSSRDSFKAADWPGWSAKAEGNALLLEGEGRIVELPRNHCVIDWSKAVEAPVKRGPGRPAKAPEAVS